jgi:hypothetical protein
MAGQIAGFPMPHQNLPLLPRAEKKSSEAMQVPRPSEQGRILLSDTEAMKIVKAHLSNGLTNVINILRNEDSGQIEVHVAQRHATDVSSEVYQDIVNLVNEEFGGDLRVIVHTSRVARNSPGYKPLGVMI